MDRSGYPPPPQSLAIERASSEQLRTVQEERLAHLVARAWKRVPFYRERWKKHGVRVEEVGKLADLRRLPVMSKKDFEEDLNEHPPIGTYQGDFEAVRVQASSGTSGNPKPFFQTRNDWRVIGNLWARRFHAQGVRRGDIFQVVFTYSLFIAGFTATEGAMKAGALVVPTGSGAVTPSERQIKILRDWGVTVLAGTPSYTLHLANVAEKAGMKTKRDFQLRVTCHTGEPLTEAARKAIEERWGVTAYDNYGSVETGAPTFECEQKDGYHINEDAYIFEILDPETLEPLSPGQDGVIVVTSLFKEASPVIRYNLEDVSSFLKAPCPCGRTFRRLAKIKGRVNEMLKVRGLPLYPAAVEGVLQRLPGFTNEYRLIVDRVGAQDTLVLEAECRSSAGDLAALKEKLERKFKVATGLSVNARLFAPGELERILRVESRVKVKRILDRRSEGHVP